MAIKVKLRQKAISGQRKSLYLDFYPPILHPETGEPTRREFLNLYVFDKPKGPIDKQHNKEAIERAEFIRRNRDNEVNKPEIYSDFEKEQLRVKELGTRSFMEYFQKVADKREGTTKNIWESTLMHLKTFTGGKDLLFNEINEKLSNDFREFLLTAKIANSGKSKLAHNTVTVYFSKFKGVLRQAYKDGLIQTELSTRIQGVAPEETRRAILTPAEVNALIKAECGNEIIKKAAIFSVYTGLRFSDIKKLTWGEIEETKDGQFVINFKQQKTKGIETLPITAEALKIVEPRKGNADPVFPNLMYSAYYNKVLYKWIGLAGITKDITFHSFRHTYATLQLSLGTDIYTVSKLLGHRDVKTTQIYAKMIDENKRAAANRISFDVDNWK